MVARQSWLTLPFYVFNQSVTAPSEPQVHGKIKKVMMGKCVFYRVMAFVALVVVGLPVCAATWKPRPSVFSYDGMEYKKNRFAIDFGVGGGQGFGAFDLGARYQHNFAPFLAWDALSVKVTLPTEGTFDENPDLQIMTGVRGTTPNFYKDMSGYLSFALGYGFSTDDSAYNNDGGICLELGVGVNLCKYVYIGYAFNFQKVNITDEDGTDMSSNGKVHFFRLGFVF